jgi:hypothetical protein
MATKFEDPLFKDMFSHNKSTTGNLIKSEDVQVTGASKITFEEDDVDGIRIMLKKDVNDNLKEIKFVCSCGQTKSIILDYSE